MDRDGLIALLEDQHTFPGPFEMRAVIRPAGRAAVVSAVSAVDALAVARVTERASRSGTYLSVRLHLEVEHPTAVLDAYEVLEALDEVLMTL